MSLCEHFTLMAEYNQWMNEKVYTAAGHLSSQELAKDRGAFFGSILGTLNHLVMADLVWLRRFKSYAPHRARLEAIEQWPAPLALAQVLYPHLPALQAVREPLDQLIRDWAGDLRDGDMDVELDYQNMQGIVARRRYSSLIQHVFNHQTHHRGQVTTLLTQEGQDVGVTDLLVLIPNYVT